VELTQKALQLTDLEAGLLPDLDQGTALWKVAGRAALVANVVAPGEWILCDTDGALAV
jgi:hypothetical protein